jgi:hypothetical protein
LRERERELRLDLGGEVAQLGPLRLGIRLSWRQLDPALGRDEPWTRSVGSGANAACLRGSTEIYCVQNWYPEGDPAGVRVQVLPVRQFSVPAGDWQR